MFAAGTVVRSVGIVGLVVGSVAGSRRTFFFAGSGFRPVELFAAFRRNRMLLLLLLLLLLRLM